MSEPGSLRESLGVTLAALKEIATELLEMVEEAENAHPGVLAEGQARVAEVMDAENAGSQNEET